ncbi:MAG: TonB-dependent receptor [Proteobacteria bacterium]|nr:TonB-dependent receptor [Pseudomonadota bacterium]
MVVYQTRTARSRLLLSASFGLPALALSGALVTAQPAHADAIETVVVTAEKRPENVQNVGMSISAFSGKQLEDAHITNVADLGGSVPSLNFTLSNNNRNSSVVIRNVGTSGTNPGTEPDVGVFIDGVFIPVAGPIYSELTDVSTVEVLRGPQGTLYGRNTPVGALNITTKAPSDQFEAEVTAEYGNYDHYRLMGLVGGEITEGVDGRLTVWKDTHSGYLKNLYDNSRVSDGDKYGARGRVRWTVDGNTTVDVVAYYSYMSSTMNNAVQIDPLGVGGLVFGYNPTPSSFATSGFVVKQLATNPSHPYVVAGDWEVDSATPSLNKTKMQGLSFEVNRELPFMNAVLTDIAAYNGYYDYSPNVSPGGLPLDIATNAQHDLINSFSNELRIASEGPHFIDYVAGMYYFHDDLQYNALLTIDNQANRLYPASNCGGGTCTTNPGDRSDLNYAQSTTSLALFGQMTMHVTDSLRFLGGARWSYDNKGSHIDQELSNVGAGTISKPFLFAQTGSTTGPTSSALAGRINQNSVTYMYGGQYDVMQDVMAYFTVSSGFKEGGFNSRSASAPQYQFDPETSMNYEVGAKSMWFDHRLLVNLDVFRMLVHGYQQSVLQASGSGFVIGNAGNFQNQGFELDTTINPIDPLTINASASYIDSLITGGAEHSTCDTTYPHAGSPPPATSGPYFNGTNTSQGCNFNGLTLPYAPKWQWSLGARWEQPAPSWGINWWVSANVTGVSSKYLDASLDPRSLQSGYELFNATIGVESLENGLKVDLWGRNLTNQHYFTAAASQTQGAQVSAGGTAAINGFIGWQGQPRTFGVEAKYQF